MGDETESMTDKLEQEITTLARKSANADDSADAMKFAQAALDLAQVIGTLAAIKGP